MDVNIGKEICIEAPAAADVLFIWSLKQEEKKPVGQKDDLDDWQPPDFRQ